MFHDPLDWSGLTPNRGDLGDRGTTLTITLSVEILHRLQVYTSDSSILGKL